MKLPGIFFLTLLTCLPLRAADEGFRPLFNGKDLTGWDGNPELWSVRDGTITGTTTGPDQMKYNQFLIWRGGKVKNFELRLKVKHQGNNTGVQYRSRELPQNGPWSVGGYQCDLHPNAPYNAMVYEERGRGIITQNGQTVVIDPQGQKWVTAEHEPVKVNPAEWHDYTIIANGNHLIHQIDGKVTIDLTDHEEKARSLEGLIAFQIHKGPAMTVQIKDVMLKDLPDGGVVAFNQLSIPSDAQLMQRPGPPGKPKAKAAVPAPAPEPGKLQGAAIGAALGAKAPAAPTPAPAAPGKTDKPARPKAKKQGAVGEAIGENTATPVGRIKAPKDFKVELLYSVPGGDQGSWVNLCHDNKGRMYASDQYGILYRFTPPPAGQKLNPADVQKVPADIRAVNGMLFIGDALYVGVNDYEKKIQSGLYRLTDSNGDDQLDKVELLRGIDSKGDHGVHALVPTPDGKSFYLICGNNAILTETTPASPVPKFWGDDHLLPRMPDGRGHNRDVMAPGGIIYKVSNDGKQFDLFSSGYRNIFDAGMNSDGELFTYDADMEYDFNTPWYRPTRVNHVVSGSEYGWRNGAGKYPEFYTDNLPATLNIGPGSPTGTTFGYGAKFPAKYQKSFFILDWSWGKLYAVQLKENGSSYTGTKEEFITGSPLPLTDAIIRPQDGAMYFTIGGRRVQSGLYRVTYHGSESTSPVDLTPKSTPERTLRHQLEAFHGAPDPKAIETAWPHLGSPDRFISAAARIAIEHQPVAQWGDKVFSETDPAKQLPVLLSYARATGVCPIHRKPGHTVNQAAGQALFAALLKMDWAKLTPEQRLAHVRITEIVLHRFGNPDNATVAALIAKLDPAYPADSFELNWLLTETLAYLQAPNTAAKAMALIAAAPSQEPQLEYARSLRFLKTGWTPALRKAQLEWFLKAANYKGGASFDKFVEFIRNDTLATFSEAEKTEFAALIEQKPERKSAIELAGDLFVGRTPTQWTLEELSAAAQSGMKNRDFATGQKMFAAAACYACHRFGNAGGMTGPDLTGAGGRYSPHDLLDQIINPSKEINEQFAPILVTKNNGDVITGVVVNLNGDGVTLNTDSSNPNQQVAIDRKEVKSIEASKVSPMPPMLLMMLKKEEILDLTAYILSGGDKANAMFKASKN
jgi:putative heme-binding domain-containing protein